MDARRETLRLIREDCENDAKGLDGQEFTGLAVGTMFGNVLAMIDALVKVIETLIPLEQRDID